MLALAATVLGFGGTIDALCFAAESTFALDLDLNEACALPERNIAAEARAKTRQVCLTVRNIAMKIKLRQMAMYMLGVARGDCLTTLRLRSGLQTLASTVAK
jgi:hypothetical protein